MEDMALYSHQPVKFTSGICLIDLNLVYLEESGLSLWMSSLHPILNMQFDHTLCFVSQSSPFVALQEIFHLHSSQFLFLVPLPPTLIDKTIGETTIFLM